MEVWKAVKELRVAEELLEECRREEQTEAIETVDLPVTHLAGSGEKHLTRAHAVSMTVEPEPPAPARHQQDVVERKAVRLPDDERRHLVDPRDVDQDFPTVFRPVEIDPHRALDLATHSRKVPEAARFGGIR